MEDKTIKLYDLVEEIDNDKEWKETTIKENKIVSSIVEITSMLDTLDQYFEELPTKQSRVDEELSDLLHFIENPNNKINNKQAMKLIKLIQQKRLERRKLLNDFEIKKVFNENRNKISYTNQRQFFLNSIYKKEKELNNDYKPRWLDNETIITMIK